jgi:hypothetical protein
MLWLLMIWLRLVCTACFSEGEEEGEGEGGERVPIQMARDLQQHLEAAGALSDEADTAITGADAAAAADDDDADDAAADDDDDDDDDDDGCGVGGLAATRRRRQVAEKLNNFSRVEGCSINTCSSSASGGAEEGGAWPLFGRARSAEAVVEAGDVLCRQRTRTPCVNTKSWVDCKDFLCVLALELPPLLCARYLPAGWFHEVTSYSHPAAAAAAAAVEEVEEVGTTATAASAVGSGRASSDGGVDGFATDAAGAPYHLAFNYWLHPPDTADFSRPYSSPFWVRDWQKRASAL